MTTGVRYTLAFVAPLVATLILTPVAVRVAHSTGIIAQPTTNRFHRVPTPYLGGVAIAAGLLVAVMATTGSSPQIVAILLGAMAMAGLGLIDDWRNVGPGAKIVVEALAGLALWSVGVRAGFFGAGALDLILTVLWVTAAVNAVNMLDNMDGVTPTVVAVSAIGFFAIAAHNGDYLVGSLALAIVGASLGFLRYNLPPARIFLGDAGTLMMGFLLASLGLKLDLVGSSNVERALIPALLLGVPLFDMVLVVTARVRDGRPFYLGGTDHTAHRLSARGLSGRTVLAAALATQAICSTFAFWLNEAADDRVAIIAAVEVTAVALVAWVMFLRMERPDPVPVQHGTGAPAQRIGR